MKRICNICGCKYQRKFLIDTIADKLCTDCNYAFLQAVEELSPIAKPVIWLKYVKHKGMNSIEDETWLKPEQQKAIITRFDERVAYYSKLLKEAKQALREIKKCKMELRLY